MNEVGIWYTYGLARVKKSLLRLLLFFVHSHTYFLFSSVSSHHKCLNNPESFCYICGSFTNRSQRANVSAFVKQTYLMINKSFGSLTRSAISVSRVCGCRPR